MGYLGAMFGIASAPIVCLFNYFAWHHISIYRNEALPLVYIIAYGASVFCVLLPLGIVVTK